MQTLPKDLLTNISAALITFDNDDFRSTLTLESIGDICNFRLVASSFEKMSHAPFSHVLSSRYYSLAELDLLQDIIKSRFAPMIKTLRISAVLPQDRVLTLLHISAKASEHPDGGDFTQAALEYKGRHDRWLKTTLGKDDDDGRPNVLHILRTVLKSLVNLEAIAVQCVQTTRAGDPIFKKFLGFDTLGEGPFSYMLVSKASYVFGLVNEALPYAPPTLTSVSINDNVCRFPASRLLEYNFCRGTLDSLAQQLPNIISLELHICTIIQEITADELVRYLKQFPSLRTLRLELSVDEEFATKALQALTCSPLEGLVHLTCEFWARFSLNPSSISDVVPAFLSAHDRTIRHSKITIHPRQKPRCS